MRAVVTRVRWARVVVGSDVVGEITAGACALVGAGHGDTASDADWLAKKLCAARFLEDAAGKMNRSLLDTGGSLLLVSQFTLYGDLRSGNRPSFSAALAPELAEELLGVLRARVETRGVPVETGRFGAHMHVESLNDGPVTLLLDSKKTF